MKKLFILAAAIVAFASCSKEPETIVNDGSIKFMSAQTRATVETKLETLQESGKGFYVTGYANTTSIFENQLAAWNSEGYWKTEEVKYWADGTDYNFFAVYPSYEPTVAQDLSSAKYSFTNDGKSVDLILAGTKLEDVDKTRTDAADLTFNHALARVKFVFENAFTQDGITVTVTDVELRESVKTADVTIGNDNKITWSNFEATPSLTIPFTLTACNKIALNGKGNTNYRYIIPRTQKYQLACRIVVADRDDQVIREFDYTTTPITVDTNTAADAASTDIASECGQTYVYTMKVSTGLNPITFTCTVSPWVDDQNKGEIEFPNN